MPVKLRWRFVAAVSLATAGFAACGFPDVTFAPDVTADSGKDARADGTVSEVGPRPDEDGSFDAETVDAIPPPVELEASTETDADTRGDGEGRIEAGPDGGCDAADPCDCDNDKSLHEASTCLAPVGTTPDCDDLDPVIRPGKGYTAVEWQSPHTPVGDFNCDGQTDKQWPENVPCSGLLPANCTQGFEAAEVACGTIAKYNYCQLVNLLGIGLVCSVKSYEMRIQGCK